MSKVEILAQVAAGTLTVEAASAMLASPAGTGKLTAKVSEKGAASVYGLQRMPVTLYVEQWERLLEFADELKSFLKANNAKLTRKAR